MTQAELTYTRLSTTEYRMQRHGMIRGWYDVIDPNGYYVCTTHKYADAFRILLALNELVLTCPECEGTNVDGDTFKCYDCYAMDFA